MKTFVQLQFLSVPHSHQSGKLYLQLIQEQQTQVLMTPYVIYRDEWDEINRCIQLPTENLLRKRQVDSIKRRVQWDIHILEKIIVDYEERGLLCQLSHVIAAYKKLCKKHSLFSFMDEVVEMYRNNGQARTAETYQTTLNSFKRFREEVDVMLEELVPELLQAYENYLKSEGVSPNSVCFYMHRLRAVYNRAVDQGLIEQRFPFRRVRKTFEKTIKRAIHVKYICKLKNLPLKKTSSLAFARDIFLFSFYTRGMSFVDIAYLLKKDLQNGILTYRRKKTGQKLQIHWEACMQQIVNRYPVDEGSPFLFPIIRYQETNHRRKYLNALMRVNRNLKKLGEQIGIPVPLTMYVARHSWATAAQREGIPISVISEGMGHNNEKTTQIYLASIENSVVDKANRKILKLIE